MLLTPKVTLKFFQLVKHHMLAKHVDSTSDALKCNFANKQR